MHRDSWSDRSPFRQVNLHAAGIDVGSQSSWVAVPPDSSATPVREFGMFTPDLEELARYLRSCQVTTVVLESTGVYWIALYEVLDASGFEVLLVDAHHVKQVSGRKTDITDCQWLQQLHTFGLLRGAYRPTDALCALRSLVRQRAMLVEQRKTHIQHMQKALTQMNLHLHHVISDITGVSGMQILRAILAGERDVKVLASLRDRRIRASEETVMKALTGNYRHEHLFALRQAMSLYDLHSTLINDCEKAITAQAAVVAPPKPPSDSTTPTDPPPSPPPPRRSKPGVDEQMNATLSRVAGGVDLTTIDGISSTTAAIVISEIGGNVNAWPSERHFASWLRICPNPRISGGKLLKRGGKRPLSRAALALRQAAQSLNHSKSALGSFFRRLKNRIGAVKATTAAAHKLARIIYRLLKNGQDYVDQGQKAYEDKIKQRSIDALAKRAKGLGFKIVPT
jgi:transposase